MSNVELTEPPSRASIRMTWLLLYTPDALRRLQLPLGVMVTDLDTEHGGTEANKRDRVKQVGRKNDG